MIAVVPAEAGTYNHRHQSCLRLWLRSRTTRAMVSMDPGSRVAWPGRHWFRGPSLRHQVDW